MSRCDEAHVDFLRLHRTHPADFAFLQYAQKSCLSFQRKFADFVEKQGAAISCFNETGTPGAGTGERAFFMAEQLGLDQGFGDCCAVDRNHRGLGPTGQVVQRARYQFLTRTGLALNQHVRVSRRDFANLAVHVLHRRARADNADLAVAVVRTGLVASRSFCGGGAFGLHALQRLAITKNA